MKKASLEEDEDRISALPDELIHHILSFSQAELAVQTSVLSKRWKLIWTTLPFLNLNRYDHRPYSVFVFDDSETKFANKFLSHRNVECDVLKLNLVVKLETPPHLIYKFIDYAISHNVVDLNVDVMRIEGVKLSTFSSNTIKKLRVRVDFSERLLESDCWSLPVLTSLELVRPFGGEKNCKLPRSYLICLPCLQSLTVSGFDLPKDISFPGLTTLCLVSCKLPVSGRGFPALLTLTLDNVAFPKDESRFFKELCNLRNLTLLFWTSIAEQYCINCPQLVNLGIDACVGTISSHSGVITVLAPKIRNFSCVGLIPITFGVCELENVNIKLQDKITAEPKKMRKNFRRIAGMFQGVRCARILTLDSKTIEALSAVSDFLSRSPSPFSNLKYVKVPPEYIDSSIFTNLKCYLLSCSPKASIITTLPEE